MNAMQNLTLKDQKEITRLRRLFPQEITVRAHRSEDGGFCAEILAYPGCFTEGDTFSELIEMINDAMMTYFEVPEKYISFMPNYLAPLAMAQKFGVFPVIDMKGNLKLKIASIRETVKN